MLLSLKVQNYALIEQLHIEFHEGLNIITGETGAGKSILLGALGLILGKRADMGVLSNKDKKCVVEAEFDLKDYNLEALFEEHDVDYEQYTVFRREILSSGKSRAFVNDTPVNLSSLQELALQLVDIHSQHQNLLLNKQAYLLGLIDKHAGIVGVVNEVAKVYRDFKAAEKTFLKQEEEYNTIKKEYDFISHQFAELEEAKLQIGEMQDLEKELDELENAGDIKQAFAESYDVLADEESGILDQVHTVIQRLRKVSGVYSKGNEFVDRFDSISIELKDLKEEVSGVFEKMDYDPERYETVKNRVSQLNGLMVKYKAADVDQLIKLKETLGEKVSLAVDGGFDLDKSRKQLEDKKSELYSQATKLSKKRQGSFNDFVGLVTEYLKELGLEHSHLAIERTEQEISTLGVDAVTFAFSANKNHPLQDVSKIASGGEMSRLMLAIKSVLSNSTGMPTLILDEIDTGVSGEIANKVGNIIKKITSGIQIINITHLPQVASKGKSHFLVYKDHEQEVTRTLVKKLSEQERVQEIAKMLSGEELTDAALENARILLSN